MTYLMVRHHVHDFDSWKPVFDGHAPARRAAGLADHLVLRTKDDPNQVTVLMQVSDIARAKAFAASDDLHQTMRRSGVDGPPEATFLDLA